MKLTIRIIVGLVILFLILCLLGPSHILVERSRKMRHSTAAVFEQVNRFENWNNWSPWYFLDTTAVQNYVGTQGVNSEMSWQSDHEWVGVGNQKITESILNEKIVSAMEFDGQGGAIAYFLFESQGDGCNVVWGFDKDVGFFQRPIFLFMDMDDMLGPFYEDGLRNLDEFLNDHSEMDGDIENNESTSMEDSTSVDDTEPKQQVNSTKEDDNLKEVAEEEEQEDSRVMDEEESEEISSDNYAFVNAKEGKETKAPQDVDLMSRAFEEIVIQKVTKGVCSQSELGNDVILSNLNGSKMINATVEVKWQDLEKKKHIIYRSYTVQPSQKLQIGCMLSEANKKAKTKWRIVNVAYQD